MAATPIEEDVQGNGAIEASVQRSIIFDEEANSVGNKAARPSEEDSLEAAQASSLVSIASDSPGLLL